MGFFKQIEGEAAVMVEGGVYKQVDLYSRDGYLYAKAGGGFVRLMADGSTTKPRLRLDSLSWSGDLARDSLGRLCQPGAVEGAKLLGADATQKLLVEPAQ